MLKLGKEQLKVSWMDRLVIYKIPVSDTILLSLLNLPDNPNKATEKDLVLTAAMLEKGRKAGKA